MGHKRGHGLPDSAHFLLYDLRVLLYEPHHMAAIRASLECGLFSSTCISHVTCLTQEYVQQPTYSSMEYSRAGFEESPNPSRSSAYTCVRKESAENHGDAYALACVRTYCGAGTACEPCTQLGMPA